MKYDIMPFIMISHSKLWYHIQNYDITVCQCHSESDISHRDILGAYITTAISPLPLWYHRVYHSQHCDITGYITVNTVISHPKLWYYMTQGSRCWQISTANLNNKLNWVLNLPRSLEHLESWGVVRTRYVPARTRYVLCHSIIPPCTAPSEYVRFTPSTYLVRNCYPEYVPSTYFSNKYVLGTYWVQKAW